MSAPTEAQNIKLVECPPVTVDLSLIRNADDSQSVIASSTDGVILGGVDIPVENAKAPPSPKLWAVGGAISSRGEFGGWIDRDIGWLRVGTQINTVGTAGVIQGVEGWIKAGIVF